MTMKFITEYIEKKLNESRDYVRYTFYELRVKCNLSADDTEEFLDVNKDYFENKGYKVFFTGDEYTYKNEIRKVSDNELMIAIKE